MESYFFAPSIFFLIIFINQIISAVINQSKEVEKLRNRVQYVSDLSNLRLIIKRLNFSKYEKQLSYATSLLDMQNNYLISYSCPNMNIQNL